MAAVRASWTIIENRSTGEDDVDFHDETLSGLTSQAIGKMFEGVILIGLETCLHAHVWSLRLVTVGVLSG